MDGSDTVDLGPVRRRFAYNGTGAGLFLLGVIAAPLPVMGLVSAVVLPLTVGRGQPLRGGASDAFSALLCLILVATFGYFLWSAFQVSGYRNGVYTVHERGLVHQVGPDPVHGLPAREPTVIPWSEVVEVGERRRTSWTRWLLPPNRRYQAAFAVREGWALTVTGATRDAPELAAAVRAGAGLARD
jgi:hypothetical protein